MEKASGNQVLYCDFAAMENLSGFVLLAFIYVKGGKKQLKKSLIWSFKNEEISFYLTAI